MSNTAWLPPLVILKDDGGNWEIYLDRIYNCFKRDFVDSKPIFQGRRLGLKRLPITHGKEATFWHFIQEGSIEEERTPDLRRCERICWPKPVIECQTDEIKIWRNTRGRENRICIWLEPDEYLVVLADRGSYILPWTAYSVVQDHQKRKLRKEYETFTKAQKG